MAKTGGAWEFAQDLLVALIGQDVMLTVSLLGALAMYFIWKTKRQWWTRSRKICLTIIVGLVAVPLAYYAWLSRPDPPQPAQKEGPKLNAEILESYAYEMNKDYWAVFLLVRIYNSGVSSTADHFQLQACQPVFTYDALQLQQNDSVALYDFPGETTLSIGREELLESRLVGKPIMSGDRQTGWLMFEGKEIDVGRCSFNLLFHDGFGQPYSFSAKTPTTIPPIPLSRKIYPDVPSPFRDKKVVKALPNILFLRGRPVPDTPNSSKPRA